MSVTGRMLQLHERLYELTDGRIGQYARLWKIVNDNNHDRYAAYQKQTNRPIPVIAITPG